MHARPVERGDPSLTHRAMRAGPCAEQEGASLGAKIFPAVPGETNLLREGHSRNRVCQTRFDKQKDKPRMTSTPARKKQGGRPPSYTPEQVYGIIARLIACGTPSGEIDAPMVKEELCSAFGISPTIRLESLQKQVDVALSDYESDQSDALLNSLPDTVAASIDHFMAGAREAFALMVARQNARCQAQADESCDELRADKRTAQWRIAELEAEIEGLKTDRQMLADERDACAREIAGLQSKLTASDEELLRLRGSNDIVQQILAQMQQVNIPANALNLSTDDAGK